MKTIRSFLAIRLDLDTVRNLAATQKRLKERCDGAGLRIRWVPPPNIHLTIRFLGQITEPMAYAVKDMLEPLTAQKASFQMTVKGIGVFPDMRRPRVVWAGIEQGAESLVEIHSSVCDRLTKAGFDFDDKPFRSHVTIGRVKSGEGETLAECLSDELEAEFGSSSAKAIECYRSDLMPHGAEYHKLWRLPFMGPAQQESPVPKQLEPQSGE